MQGTLHKDQCTVCVISRSIPLRVGNVADKSCRGNQRPRFMLNNLFFRKSCRLWDNVGKFRSVVQATDDNTAQAHCNTHTHTHTQYVILIAFPLKQCIVLVEKARPCNHCNGCTDNLRCTKDIQHTALSLFASRRI